MVCVRYSFTSGSSGTNTRYKSANLQVLAKSVCASTSARSAQADSPAHSGYVELLAPHIRPCRVDVGCRCCMTS